MIKTYTSPRTEQRQHVNLSQHTFDIIENDSYNFYGDTNISGIINEIILGSIETSTASISIASGNYREHLFEMIKAEKGIDSLSDAEIQTVEYCVQSYIRELTVKHTISDKGVIRKIRLRNEIYDELYPENGTLWAESKYYPTPGHYIRALCEDYASKTFFERETIIFRENLLNLQPHISNNGRKHILNIKYISSSEKLHNYDVKPLRLSTTIEADYHYLICLAQEHGSEKNEWKPASLRISRISHLRAYALSYGSGKLTAAQIKELNDSITTNGVEFLFEKADSITVNLTQKGVSLYHQLTHLRPKAVSKTIHEDGTGTFTFLCTAAQINNYFFSFGENAKIISPVSLAENFKSRYEQSANNYL